MNFDSWIQLITICFLGATSPGPSLALVVTNTVAGGRICGIVTGIGHGIGIGLWGFLTAIGIAKIIVDESNILVTLQLIGALVLAYIGVRTIIAVKNLSKEQKGKSKARKTLIKGVSEGFLIAIINPKIALFFIAIFSHLVRADSNWIETGLMGITAALVDAFWYISVAVMLTGTNLIKILHNKETTISRISGSLLILFALYFLTASIQKII